MLLSDPRQPAKKPSVKIQAVLIDPFKCELFSLAVDWNDMAGLHKLLDCELIQSVALPQWHVLWVDESGLLREPFVYPQFKILGVNGDCPISGYGLITGLRRNGDVTDCNVRLGDIELEFEEHWQRRINPDLCIDQLLRVYFDN